VAKAILEVLINYLDSPGVVDLPSGDGPVICEHDPESRALNTVQKSVQGS